MIVIVEGIDRVGKSTLVNKLVDIGFNKIDAKLTYDGCDNRVAQIVHSNRMLAQIELLKYVHEDIVIDRFHLSQIVYGILERNEFDENMLDIDKRLSELDAYIVFVEPTDIVSSSEQHGKRLHAHQSLFDFCKYITKIPVLQADYDSLDSIVDMIRRNKNGNRS